MRRLLIVSLVIFQAELIADDQRTVEFYPFKIVSEALGDSSKLSYVIKNAKHGTLLITLSGVKDNVRWDVFSEKKRQFIYTNSFVRSSLFKNTDIEALELLEGNEAIPYGSDRENALNFFGDSEVRTICGTKNKTPSSPNSELSRVSFVWVSNSTLEFDFDFCSDRWENKVYAKAVNLSAGYLNPVTDGSFVYAITTDGVSILPASTSFFSELDRPLAISPNYWITPDKWLVNHQATLGADEESPEAFSKLGLRLHDLFTKLPNKFGK